MRKDGGSGGCLELGCGGDSLGDKIPTVENSAAVDIVPFFCVGTRLKVRAK